MMNSETTASGTRIAVLAIDDDADDLAILRHHLQKMDGVSADLQTFTRVDQGLAALEAGDFDAVFLDFHMGAQTGLDAFAEIQLRGIEVPTILVTDQGDEAIAVEALQAGFADYIPKGAIRATSLRRSILNAIEKFRLRQSVAHYHEQLEDTVRNLNIRNAEIESFYHSLAHELKTPLTAIREFVSIVLDNLQGPLTDAQRESLLTARNACDHMVVCIHDLLDSSRLETGKLTLQMSEHALAEVLESALSETRASARDKGVDLRGSVDADCPPLRLDEHRILQVLSNLIGNALKYTEPGGAVSVQGRRSRADARFVEVSVKDNGCGIEEAERERIFDRLYQSSDKDAAVHGGLGLGLNLCRELVRLHGGDIRVDSIPDRGSEFTFTLPIQAEA